MRTLDGQQCLVALVEELTGLSSNMAALPQNASLGQKLENSLAAFVENFLWCLARHGWTLQPSSANVQFDSLEENLKLFQGMSQEKRAAYLASSPRFAGQ